MTTTLTSSQSAALFDILTHYDTYAEIRDFRDPGSLNHYGPPFTFEDHQPSTSPILQTLLSRFLLTLPGLKDLPDDFWKVQCHDIISSFELSNLSESYDKGVIGSRKTLATAISALIEYPVRGTYGGFANVSSGNRDYDTRKAQDLIRAFRDFMDECIYGTVLEDLVAKTAQTDKLADHTPLTKAVHEFVLVNLASFMHYTLVLSPKGQYLLKLIDNVNKLVPWLVAKQTLKIGNVASMISAMVRVGLAKMSVTSVTNWIGLTSNDDEGMNLMQYIISTALSWDLKDLESRSSKIEKERAKLGKDQLKVLKEYATKPREEQEKIRKESQQSSISIVTAILRTTTLEYHLTDPHHKQALEYLSIQLSIRDRKEIIQTLCHSHPDRLTQSVRELVDAYEPVIRHAHNAIDLSGTVGDMEYFLKDMIKLGKIQTDKSGKSIIPTVGDFIQLLRKHQYSTHTFMHQCCKNGPEVTSWYLEWAKTAAAHFKRETDPKSPEKGAGDLTPDLNSLFETLPEEKRSQILPVLDTHIAFVDEMHSQSAARLAAVLKSPTSRNPHIAKILSGGGSKSVPSSRASSPGPDVDRLAKMALDASQPTSPTEFRDPNAPTPLVSSDPGPGAYLARWQDLLDSTLITPLTQQGDVMRASSAKVVNESAADVDGNKLVQFEVREAKGEKIKVGKKKPDVRIVVECMAEEFRRLLANKSCYW